MTAKKELDISVIIPFRDKSSMTIDCVNSLFRYGPNVKEIILVSNNSKPEELDVITEYISHHKNISLYEYNKPFNYQTVNNWAVTKSTGQYLIFLNNDTELVPESTGLVEHMIKSASENKIGIVGCLLLYGDKKHVQHAGVFLVSGGLAEHVYVGEKYSDVKNNGGKSTNFPYDVTSDVDIPMTAVTAAVHVVERKKFDAINGFNEDFILCGGDVDLCIRMNKAGYQTMFTSDGGKFILHKESQSRKFSPVPFNDFNKSFESYSTAYDPKIGDKFLPKICALKAVR